MKFEDLSNVFIKYEVYSEYVEGDTIVEYIDIILVIFLPLVKIILLNRWRHRVFLTVILVVHDGKES